MSGQIVHDHDITGFKLADENLPDVSQEGNAIHRPVKDQRRGKPAHPQAGRKRGCVPMSKRHRRNAARALGGPAAQPRHLGRSSCFIDKNQP
jgi:hypothetical protein